MFATIGTIHEITRSDINIGHFLGRKPRLGCALPRSLDLFSFSSTPFVFFVSDLLFNVSGSPCLYRGYLYVNKRERRG